MNPLLINNLVIQRGDRQLCEPMSVSIKSGELLHITGKNGVGKTTLLKMLANIIPVPAGQIIWHQAEDIEWQTLFIGHKNALQTQLSVKDNLHYLYRLHHLHTPNQTKQNYVWALESVGLSGYQDTLCCHLSSGQKRRVQLARLWLITQALMASKQPCYHHLWLLDEPFTALDTSIITDLETLFKDFLALGGRIILTSHQSLNIPCQQYELTAL